ncbi:MAG: Crp/Fnr family transcriptional regulator [Winogradskyella sp.]|uniref:Crp/Fnr family transcriptional regulator n=1 Tax=Winogradskyella sp. TaxID=1883156 RepID=UPI000F410E4B|nr:Crp/Fnr family transcriptional regulator [Winogradskyella sp.]RNC87868.1 MAG: Crp/Fnr family transcriptional regulator [Winogradskyella sp.]
MKEIESYIENYFGIKGKNLSSIARLFNNTELQKNDYLLKINQYAKRIHFVKTGYLRVFAYNATGEKEITQWISNEGMFLTDLSSFMFNTPSRWNIQAISDCELYTISKEDYNSIGNYIDNWSELEKLFIAKCFVTIENRVFGQLSMTADEKVQHLLEINPKIFLQVPLQYIASMLGMTPETLSRVRRKLIS